MEKYLNYEYSDYLNRHINGLIQIGEKVESINIDFENTIHFGKGILRLYIEIEFFDFDNLTLEEKKIANNYFHNYSNLSGSKYFSFTYQPNGSGIDLNQVRFFMNAYYFSVQTLKNIKSITTRNECLFKYRNLNEDSFFILIDKFLSDTELKFYDRDFEIKYKDLYNRRFNFDCDWNQKFMDKSKLYNEYNFINTINVNEINISTALLESLYIFLINSETPFKFNFYNNLLIEKNILITQLEKTKNSELLYLLKKYCD